VICRKCGELLSDNARVCHICGARQKDASGSTLNPAHRESADCAHEEVPRKKRSGTRLQDLAGLLILIGAVALVVGLPVLISKAFREGVNPLFLVFVIIVIIVLGSSRIKRK